MTCIASETNDLNRLKVAELVGKAGLQPMHCIQQHGFGSLQTRVVVIAHDHMSMPYLFIVITGFKQCLRKRFGILVRGKLMIWIVYPTDDMTTGSLLLTPD